MEVDDDIIAKYAAKAVASKPLPTIEADYEDLLAKYSDAALGAKQKKEEQKKEQKSLSKYQPPEQRLTLAAVKELYTATGIIPARSNFWFYEGEPLIQESYLDEDTRKSGSPFGVLVLLKASKMSRIPEWTVAPTNEWFLGPVSQITGYSTSYILGFNAGFNGHAPGHRLCGYHFHCGYADGKIIATFLQKEGLLAEIESDDPFREFEDESDINELIRVKGYWREEWGPKPKFLLDTTDLTNERLQELGLTLAKAVVNPPLEEMPTSC